MTSFGVLPTRQSETANSRPAARGPAGADITNRQQVYQTPSPGVKARPRKHKTAERRASGGLELISAVREFAAGLRETHVNFYPSRRDM